jgi:hypothetical protein
MTYAMEKLHEIWYMECKEPVQVRFLTTIARELARYKLDLVGVQEVRGGREGTVKAGDYIFFYGKGKENHQLGTEFLYNTE